MTRGGSGRRGIVALAVLSLLVAACGPGPGVGPTANGDERLPGPGYFHIVADPPVAARTLVVRYLRDDGGLDGISDTFDPGEEVVIDRTTFAGSVRLRVGDATCTGSFDVQLELETDVVVRVTADGCVTSTLRVHQPGAVTH